MINLLVACVVWLNAAANVLGRSILAPVGSMPGWLSATIVAAATGVLLLVVFKYTSNQRPIKRVRDAINANLLALNFLRLDYAGLTRQLQHCQVAPVLFLWGELTVCRWFGATELTLRLLPFVAGVCPAISRARIATFFFPIGTSTAVYFPLITSAPTIKPLASSSPFSSSGRKRILPRSTALPS